MSKRRSSRSKAQAAFSDEDYELVCNDGDTSGSEPETVCNMGTEPSMKHTCIFDGTANEPADEAPAAAQRSNTADAGRTALSECSSTDIAPAGATDSELEVKPMAAEPKQAGAPAAAATAMTPAPAPVVKSAPTQVQASVNRNSMTTLFIGLLLAPSLMCLCLAVPLAAATSFYTYDNQMLPAQFNISCFRWLWHTHFMYLAAVLLLQAVWAGFMTAVTAWKEGWFYTNNALMPAPAAAAAAQRILGNRAGQAPDSKSSSAAARNKLPNAAPPATKGVRPQTVRPTAAASSSPAAASSNPAPPAASAPHRRRGITISVGSASFDDVTPLTLVAAAVLLSLVVASIIMAPAAGMALYSARANLHQPLPAKMSSTSTAAPITATAATTTTNSGDVNMPAASAISTLTGNAAPAHKWAAMMALLANQTVKDTQLAYEAELASGASLLSCISSQLEAFDDMSGQQGRHVLQAVHSCTHIVRKYMVQYAAATKVDDAIALANLHGLQCTKQERDLSISTGPPHNEQQPATTHTAPAAHRTSQEASAPVHTTAPVHAAAPSPPSPAVPAAAPAAAPQAAAPVPAHPATAPPAASHQKRGASRTTTSAAHSADAAQPPLPAGGAPAAAGPTGAAAAAAAANDTQATSVQGARPTGKHPSNSVCYGICRQRHFVTNACARCLLHAQLQQLGCHKHLGDEQVASVCMQRIQALTAEDGVRKEQQASTNTPVAQAPCNTSSWQSGMQHICTAFHARSGATLAAVQASQQRVLAAIKLGASQQRVLAAIKQGTQSAQSTLHAGKQEMKQAAEHMLHAAGAQLHQISARTAALTATHTAANLTRRAYSTVADAASSTAAGLKQRVAAAVRVSAGSGKQLLAKFKKPTGAPSSNISAAAAPAGNSVNNSTDNSAKPASTRAASVAHTFSTTASAAAVTVSNATKTAFAAAVQQTKVVQQHSAAAAASAASAVQALAGDVRQAAARAPSTMHAALATARKATRKAVLQKPAVQHVLNKARGVAARAHAGLTRARAM